MTIRPALRCRLCYSKLTKPVCEKCIPTQVKMHQIASAANQIFLARGTYIEGGKNPFQKAKV